MNELEKQVLRLIGEDVDSPDAFSDITPVRDSINDAIQEISVLTGSVKETYYLPLVSGQHFYRINLSSGEFGWITDAWIVSQRRRLEQTDLIRLNAENPRWMLDSGPPTQYMQIGEDVVGFYRAPSGGDDVVELSMVVIPKRYALTNDRVKVRDSFQWAAVHYAVSEYYASRGDANEAITWFERYMKALGLQTEYPESGEREWRYRREIRG